MGKMKDIFMLHQREREYREAEEFARREKEYINSRRSAQPAKATTQTPPKGK